MADAKMHTPPSVWLVCDNPECSAFETRRRLYLPLVGKDMYARPSVVCACSPDREMRQVNPDA